MPRKSFVLAPECLRVYREALGMTQREVGLSLNGLDDSASDEKIASATNSYSRLEKSGKTTLARAQRLAIILSTPLEWLQKALPQRREQGFGVLFNNLKGALETIKDNPRREQQLLSKFVSKTYSPWEWLQEELRMKSADELALGIAAQLERFSLSRYEDEREKLSDLLDIPIELKNYVAQVDGIWLVYSPMLQSTTVGTVIDGLANLLVHVGEILRSNATNEPTTACLRNREGCIRIDLKHEFSTLDWWIELSQCTQNIDRKGLQYGIPQPHDREFLMQSLERLLQKHAWVVKGPNMPEVAPAESLAFRVSSKAIPAIDPNRESIIRLVKGMNLRNMPKQILKPRIEGGIGDKRVWHVTYNLVPNLIKTLSDLIVVGGSWEVLKIPENPLILLEETSTDGLRITYHHIELVAIDKNNSVEVATWPSAAITDVENKIKTLLTDDKRGIN